MDHLRERHKLKRRIYSRTSRVVLLILLALLVKPTWNIYVKHQESVENVRRAQQQLVELQQKKAELEARVRDIQTHEGQDRAIREKFSVAKEGETFVVLVKDSRTPTPTTTEEKVSWWGRLMQKFR